MSTLIVSGSPHIHSDQSVKKIMFGVIYALIPAFLVSIYFFGMDALILTVVSIAACLLFEYLIQKYIIKGEITITDGSAVITGILLAFNVPSNLPLWIIIIGAFVSIGIAKMAFGGIGKNIFNPALVGRVFLLLSFPVQMTSWPVPNPQFMPQITDAVTGPTALGILKEGLQAGKTVQELMPELPSYVNDLLGNQGGSIGEVSALALLIGAVYLFYKRIITWHIPVAYLGSAFLFSGIMHLINPALYVTPFFHLIAGGMILGVFYMATDMVSSPMSAKGMIIYGVGCGIITMLIRIWGSYPEGVSFAILLMNAVTPLINRGFKPARFG